MKRRREEATSATGIWKSLSEKPRVELGPQGVGRQRVAPNGLSPNAGRPQFSVRPASQDYVLHIEVAENKSKVENIL